MDHRSAVVIGDDTGALASMSTHEAERRITRPSTHVDESAQNVQERANSPHS